MHPRVGERKSALAVERGDRDEVLEGRILDGARADREVGTAVGITDCLRGKHTPTMP